jgi:hypothetical protein
MSGNEMMRPRMCSPKASFSRRKKPSLAFLYIGTESSPPRRLLARTGANDSDLIFHRGKKSTATLAGSTLSLAVDEKVLGAWFR